MADPNTRQGKRTPVTLKIKFKSETLEQFIERYAVDVSQGGIFIRTKEPLAVGTQMKFEFQLRDASPLIAGEGTVVWTRENDPSRPAIAPGMGVRFDRLADGSQQVLEKILAEKAKQAPSRGNESPTKPPMFTDTPTRVAPAPVVAEALGEKPRTRRDSEQTPLPNPVPFHSDADDFDESAFAEATKVRSLDELAAQTAGFGSSKSEKAAEPASAEKPAEPSDDTKTATKALPADELAERRQSARADSTIADPPAPATDGDRESAPVLPSPPEHEAKKADEEKKSAKDEPAPTKLGVEPAKAATVKKEKEAPSAVATEAAKPVAPSRPSSMPVVLGILAVLVLVAGGVYFFVLRENGNKTEPVVDNTGSGSAVVETNTGSGSAEVVENAGSGSAGSADVVTNNGSAGSATEMTGSAGSAAAAAIVKTVIATNVSKGTTIEVVGTDQKGPAPLTAKLEKDKEYKARVSAPGFVAQEVDVKGGQDKVTVKLVAKQKILNIVTDPAGADVYVDGVMTGKITPSDVELTPAQAARPRNRITLKRPGFKPVDQYLDASSWNEGDSRMTGKLTVKLVVQPKVVTPPPTTGSGDAGSGSAAGSATPANTGSSAGSSSSTTTTTPPPTTTPTPSGGGAGSSADAPPPTP